MLIHGKRELCVFVAGMLLRQVNNDYDYHDHHT